jgi:hypothetical protein
MPKAWAHEGMPKRDGVEAVVQSLVLFIEATSFGVSSADRAEIVVRGWCVDGTLSAPTCHGQTI